MAERNNHLRQIQVAENDKANAIPTECPNRPEDQPRKIPEWEARLIRRAIKEGWPISEEDKAKVVSKVAKIVRTSSSPKAIVAAAKVLVSVDVANINRERTLLANELAIQKATGLIADDTSGSQVNVQVNVNNISSALQEPEYLEYLRSKSLEEDCNAGAIRT